MMHLYPHGRVPNNHPQVIQFCVEANGWIRGGEVGLGRGQNMSHLMSTCPHLHMIGVDVFRHMPEAPGEEAYRAMNHEGNRKRLRTLEKAFSERFRVLEMTSREASFRVEEESADFVFIDADHSTEGCLEDIGLWAPKVKIGGWILGHDYNRFGINEAVNKAFGGFPDVDYQVLPYSVWAKRKEVSDVVRTYA